MKSKKLNLDKYTFFGFTIIPLILYSFFYVYSVITGIKFSFTDWDGLSPDYNYIGFDNYIKLFKNPGFWSSLRITFVYAAILVIGVIVLSLILALSLNSLKCFKTLTKSIFFIPAMIGGVTISLIWDQLFYRVVPQIGQFLGIEWLSQSPLASKSTALLAVVFVNIWQAVAMPTIIFLAGLQSIPEDLYESAMMDGAGVFKRFRYITFPSILPTITVNFVLILKAGFTSFDFAYALTGGGPVKSTELIGIMIYDDAFMNLRFSLANAEACILFVIVAIVSIIQISITNKKEG